MRRALLFFLLIIPAALYAQVQIPIYTFSSGGGVSGPKYFGSIGQPMVYARPLEINSGGGVLNANNLMFAASTVDSEPPVIDYDESSILKEIKATFTDDNSISAARIFFRPIGGTEFDSVLLTPAGSDLYKTTAMNAEADSMGLEFYFKGKDSRNEVRAPAGTTSFYIYRATPIAQVPASLLVYGSTQDKYRMIAVPYVETGNITQVFSELAEKVIKKDYRIWRYVNQAWGEYDGNFNTIDRGLGYFFICKDNTVAMDLGPETSPGNNRANLFTMNLSSDWNLIGNPYTIDINWDDVLALNGNPGNVSGLYVYGGSANYDQPTVLKAFQGAFVKVTGTPPSDFRIGFPGQTLPGGRQQGTVSSDLASANWELPLYLRQGELQNSLAGIGMREEATEGLDRFDGYNPPNFFDYVELLSQRPEVNANDLTKDIVNTQSTHIWKFEPRASSGNEIELKWDNTGMGANSIPMYLYDLGRNEVIDMRQDSRYAFTPGKSRQFKIYFGINRNDLTPDEPILNEPYPNPFRETSEFRFALPGQNDPYEVELNLLSSMGQRVRTIARGTFYSGRHSITWNGQGDDNEKVASGLYFYKMTVRGKQDRSWEGRIIYTK